MNMYNFFHTRFFGPLQPTTYNLQPSGGFTLIELLVVVAIIGILSVVSFATFSGVRGKARDAVRISDISQIQTILLTENSTLAGDRAITGCPGSATSNAAVSTCTEPFAELAIFTDPQGGTTACNNASTASCAYSITNSDGSGAATTGNYQVCFFLEDRASVGITSAVGKGPAKVIFNSTNQRLGVFTAGCSN